MHDPKHSIMFSCVKCGSEVYNESIDILFEEFSYH